MSDDLEDYILSCMEPEDSIQYDLVRQTNLQLVQPRMVSGHNQGELLRLLTLILQPKKVLELGTFTGYSAISIAKGLAENGVLHTIELNDELEKIASEYFKKAEVQHKIIQHFGSAIEIMSQLNTTFDLIFIDADKREYADYYNMIMDNNLIHSGSVILADNVLWNGKVVESPPPQDAYTQGIMNFNTLVAQDNRVDKVLLPIRDGITVIRVK